MRKNGFTLIELLAVIVILAIIALIATPIILGIINDARKESQERSIELYASAVRNGIAAYQLREGKEVAVGSYTSETLPFDVEYDGEVECTTIELYDNGGVYVAGCEVNDLEVEYTYGTKQIIKGKMSICNPLEVQTEGTYTAGDKYECDVDPNKEGYDYIFYVLNSTSTEVNLIMDSNIKLDGTPVKEEEPIDKGTVAWTSEDNYGTLYPYDEDICWNEDGCLLNDKGPITAMNHLQTATAGWTNANELTINTFTDVEGNTHEMAQAFTVNARLPYISEVGATGCDIENYEEGTCPGWMVNYMVNYMEDDGYQTNAVSGVYGYWTLSSASDPFGAWLVYYNGSAFDVLVNDDGNYGIRPVINLSI